MKKIAVNLLLVVVLQGCSGDALLSRGGEHGWDVLRKKSRMGV